MATRPRTNPDASTETVASYSSYQEAQRAVDHLSDSGFAISRVSIVGVDVRYVERVSGPFSYTHAAVQGMIGGAGIGALVGFVLGALSLVDPLVSVIASALYGLLFGGVIGLALGPLSHSLWRGKRDFTSNANLEASSYEIRVSRNVAEKAKRLLQKGRLLAVR